MAADTITSCTSSTVASHALSPGASSTEIVCVAGPSELDVVGESLGEGGSLPGAGATSSDGAGDSGEDDDETEGNGASGAGASELDADAGTDPASSQHVHSAKTRVQPATTRTARDGRDAGHVTTPPGACRRP